jgi:hypothetical protein
MQFVLSQVQEVLEGSAESQILTTLEIPPVLWGIPAREVHLLEHEQMVAGQSLRFVALIGHHRDTLNFSVYTGGPQVFDYIGAFKDSAYFSFSGGSVHKTVSLTVHIATRNIFADPR